MEKSFSILTREFASKYRLDCMKPRKIGCLGKELKGSLNRVTVSQSLEELKGFSLFQKPKSIIHTNFCMEL